MFNTSSTDREEQARYQEIQKNRREKFKEISPDFKAFPSFLQNDLYFYSTCLKNRQASQ